MGDGINKREPMTIEQYEEISNLKRSIGIAQRLLRDAVKVKCVQHISIDSIREANDYYRISRDFSEKVSKVLESAESEIKSMLEAELARLESEFAGIIIGTEMKMPNQEDFNK